MSEQIEILEAEEITDDDIIDAGLCCINQIRVKRPQPQTELPYANRFRYPELREAVQ